VNLQSEVMRLWAMGIYDTASIAERVGVKPKVPYAGYPDYFPNRFARPDVSVSAGEP
jgi:hypothetical protein